MKTFQFIVSGNWAHFKKPETNNNPLTHDCITKTALIGLIGAVLGIERQDMKSQFPKLSENIIYSVEFLNSLKKVSWGFSSRTAINPTSASSPKYFEFLYNPKFKITLALKNKDSEKEFTDFLEAIKNQESIYTPVLGWHNCPANLEFVSEGNLSELKDSEFETSSFVSKEHVPQSTGNFRIGFDRLPTYQNEDFWNMQEKYKEIIYPDFSPNSSNQLKVKGDHYEYQNTNKEIEKLWLM